MLWGPVSDHLGSQAHLCSLLADPSFIVCRPGACADIRFLAAHAAPLPAGVRNCEHSRYR